MMCSQFSPLFGKPDCNYMLKQLNSCFYKPSSFTAAGV